MTVCFLHARAILPSMSYLYLSTTPCSKTDSFIDYSACEHMLAKNRRFVCNFSLVCVTCRAELHRCNFFVIKINCLKVYFLSYSSLIDS